MITWRRGKINNKIINDSSYFLKGTLLAKNSEREYIIPFGAIDSNIEIAGEKLISEMIERATWFKLYSENPQKYPNTIGFSAHKDLQDAIINSKLEVIERDILHKIFIDKSDRVYANCYSIFEYKSFLILILEIQILEINYYITISIREICTARSKGISIGLGKNIDIISSIQSALDENYLIKTALMNYHSGPSQSGYRNMGYRDLIYFEKIFKSFNKNDLFELIDTIHFEKKKYY
ncbi:TPA: hypothetical protein ACGO7C_001352 [Streptococcus suis]